MRAEQQHWRRFALALGLALGCHGLLVLRLPSPLPVPVPAPPLASRIPLQLSPAPAPTPAPAASAEATAGGRAALAPAAKAQALTPEPLPPETPKPQAQAPVPFALDAFLAAARRYSEATEGPRRLGPGSVLTATEAAYLRGWRERIERLGTLNFPPAARAAAVSEVKLRLRALLARDGRLEALSIVIGSGYPEVDAAAVAIVRQAHPYLPFPPAFGAQDRLEVVRDFTFRTR